MIKYNKIYSFNPDLYKEIEQDEALIKYIEYLIRYTKGYGDLIHAKTFSQWLETEI